MNSCPPLKGSSVELQNLGQAPGNALAGQHCQSHYLAEFRDSVQLHFRKSMALDSTAATWEILGWESGEAVWVVHQGQQKAWAYPPALLFENEVLKLKTKLLGSEACVFVSLLSQKRTWAAVSSPLPAPFLSRFPNNSGLCCHFPPNLERGLSMAWTDP